VDETNEPGWEVDPDDDWGVAVVETVGRQLRLRREAVGMRVADFAVTIGYGEDLVYKIEAGKPTRCWGRAGSSRRPGRT
jgi:ribosome-binding protein aMBF1 (putative translation factor)